jgi:hypothetical protein
MTTVTVGAIAHEEAELIQHCFQLTSHKKINAVIQLVSGIAFLCLSIPVGAFAVAEVGTKLILGESINEGMIGLIVFGVLGMYGVGWSRDAIKVLFS